MLYLIIARDGSDKEAKARRQAVREEHLAGVKPAVEDGSLHLGGAILNDEGEMIGSALLLEAPSREAVESFLERDIYTRAGVWLSFDIFPFKRAV